MNSNWQYNLYKKLKNKKINKIILPGTHDSGAYQIMTTKTFFSDDLRGDQKKYNYFRLAAKVLPPVYLIVKHWTITQNKNIYDQLMFGIRSFDLRIFWSQYKKNWYIGHSIAVNTYKKVISDFIRFLKSHKNEFVIIQIKRDFENRHTVNKKVEAFWKYNKSFKEFYKLIWFSKKIPTYEDLINSGKRIIMIIHSNLKTDNKIYNTDKLFVLDNEYVSKWPNTNVLQNSVDAQKRWLKNKINTTLKMY